MGRQPHVEFGDATGFLTSTPNLPLACMCTDIRDILIRFAGPGGLVSHGGPVTSRENVRALLDKLGEFTDDEVARKDDAQLVVDFLHEVCLLPPVVDTVIELVARILGYA